MSYRQRSEWIEDAKMRVLQNTKRTDEAARELIFLYDEAAYNVEKEINALFARFAKDNALTDAQASQLLSGREYSTWRKSVQEYMAEASGAAKDSKAMLELNTLAMKSRISQKERLLANIYQNMIDLAGDSNAKLETLLGDMLKVNYYESCFAIQRGIGLGFNVAKLDKRLIRQVLAHPWSEKHFSEAVWGACDHLAALAKREITLGFIQGSSAELNGQVFNVEDAVAGINYPPIHPNCLCIVVADFDKGMFNRKIDAAPLAENIKFQEWRRKYAT